MTACRDCGDTIIQVTGHYEEGDDTHKVCVRYHNKKQKCKCGASGMYKEYGNYCFCFTAMELVAD